MLLIWKYFDLAIQITTHQTSVVLMRSTIAPISCESICDLLLPTYAGTDTPLLDIQSIGEARRSVNNSRSLSLLCKEVDTARLGMTTLQDEGFFGGWAATPKWCNCTYCTFRVGLVNCDDPMSALFSLEEVGHRF